MLDEHRLAGVDVEVVYGVCQDERRWYLCYREATRLDDGGSLVGRRDGSGDANVGGPDHGDAHDGDSQASPTKHDPSDLHHADSVLRI